MHESEISFSGRGVNSSVLVPDLKNHFWDEVLVQNL